MPAAHTSSQSSRPSVSALLQELKTLLAGGLAQGSDVLDYWQQRAPLAQELLAKRLGLVTRAEYTALLARLTQLEAMVATQKRRAPQDMGRSGRESTKPSRVNRPSVSGKQKKPGASRKRRGR